ncbi:MAG: hypothetical protein KF803_14135 [Cyclobacteriaceae bacterium]|nr:hypothetical protein [Cyclobacteriaceae bacterium]
MKTTNQEKAPARTLPALVVLGAGLVLLLLVLKVIGDGEPGALPLFMIIAGAIWYFVARNRNK